jgi:hypothetical protein
MHGYQSLVDAAAIVHLPVKLAVGGSFLIDRNDFHFLIPAKELE